MTEHSKLCWLSQCLLQMQGARGTSPRAPGRFTEAPLPPFTACEASLPSCQRLSLFSTPKEQKTKKQQRNTKKYYVTILKYKYISIYKLYNTSKSKQANNHQSFSKKDFSHFFCEKMTLPQFLSSIWFFLQAALRSQSPPTSWPPRCRAAAQHPLDAATHRPGG